ncbi:AraC family transcriptional regulator [Cupriavidus basilensis]|uniref:AraC family transcriptional regulator n=1 Tax=Cupriavidus basilensis TaxID=68895 RepID=UPI002851E5FA|nr:helix-turn-helix transcriptional regulator [Cupriavidus basilensis]MDR3384285.1 helix-turn-helix transcriptional regulator [Cupriavidus basilensis]
MSSHPSHPASSASVAADTASLLAAFADTSERPGGPALIAMRGADKADNEFRLGTRELGWHSHVRGQLFCIDNGLVHVRTRRGSWLLPAQRAGWMPPGEMHRVTISGVLSGWNVWIAPTAAQDLPSMPCVVGTSDVMRALISRAASWPSPFTLDAAQERITAVLLDEIRQAPQQPLHLPLPTDRRACRISNAILAQPDDHRSLVEWAAWAGLSARTLSRLFLGETGLSFANWRQQARLTLALERLARGEAVGEVAQALGYATPSNFIAMFRRAFGDSPARYFASRGVNA